MRRDSLACEFLTVPLEPEKFHQQTLEKFHGQTLEDQLNTCKDSEPALGEGF